MQVRTVRYMSLPDIEDGVSGFYGNYKDKRCIEPSKPYPNGKCHTTGDELDELARKVGFWTREEYAEKRKKPRYSSWKNSYGHDLSSAVKEALESNGIVWNIDGQEVLFQCPKGEFIRWPGKRYE
ncbi:hypothetical protein [Bacillus sp. AK031]